MQLGEFFIALGFDVDDTKLKGFNDEVKDVRNGLLKIGAVATGTIYAINKFVAGSVDAATSMRNFNNETGQSIEGLQKWQIAAQLTNASMGADAVTASFKKMSSAIADVTMGRGGGEFAMLGTGDVRGMSVEEVLEELGQNFDQNVSRYGLQQTVTLMESIGFDKGMLNALKLSTEELNGLAQNRMMTPENQKKLVELGESLSKFTVEFKFFKDQLAADWSPTLIDAIDSAIPAFEKFADRVSFLGLQISMDIDNINRAVQALSETLGGFGGNVGRGFGAFVSMFRGGDEGNYTAANFGNSGAVYRNDNIARMESLPRTQSMENIQSTMSNVYHIQSSADPQTLADMIVEQNQRRQINPAASDQNTGSIY